MSPTTATTTAAPTSSIALRRLSWNGFPVDIAAVFGNNNASRRRHSSPPANETHHRPSPCPRRSAFKHPPSESPSQDSSRASSPTLSLPIDNAAVDTKIALAAALLSPPKGILHRLRRKNLSSSPRPRRHLFRLEQLARFLYSEVSPVEWDELSLTPESDAVEILPELEQKVRFKEPPPWRQPVVKEVCVVEEASEQPAWCDFMICIFVEDAFYLTTGFTGFIVRYQTVEVPFYSAGKNHQSFQTTLSGLLAQLLSDSFINLLE
ncbi:hypothetical protein FB451DRAFT_1184082 [Mycena latifolia]|nr:hypothetical protein FB451DRAFT_1184082 [Mycena latifolia]